MCLAPSDFAWYDDDTSCTHVAAHGIVSFLFMAE